MATYKIVRFYQDDRRPRVIKRGLTESQAKQHCNDPETSSHTASRPAGCNGDQALIDSWNSKLKHWFDGFAKEAN